MKIGNGTDKVVAVHQPNYLPWPGYFYKIAHTDLFIFLDDAKFTKNSFINRNRVKGSQGAFWLTVPVNANSSNSILEVRMANHIWRTKHIKTLRSAYGRAPHFNSEYPWIEEILLDQNFEDIASLNIYFVMKISRKLGIGSNAKFKRSSEFCIESKGDDRLIALVKAAGGTAYLSGKGGLKYQNAENFEKADIKLEYSSFELPVYPQLWGGFTPKLSIVDLLFNVGIEEAASLLERLGRSKLT